MLTTITKSGCSIAVEAIKTMKSGYCCCSVQRDFVKGCGAYDCVQKHKKNAALTVGAVNAAFSSEYFYS